MFTTTQNSGVQNSRVSGGGRPCRIGLRLRMGRAWAAIAPGQRRISHNGLRTVLSGTRWLERCGAWMAPGPLRKRRQVEQEFHRERID